MDRREIECFWAEMRKAATRRWFSFYRAAKRLEDSHPDAATYMHAEALDADQLTRRIYKWINEGYAPGGLMS